LVLKNVGFQLEKAQGDQRTKKEETIEFLKLAIQDVGKSNAIKEAFAKKFPGVTNPLITFQLRLWDEGKADWVNMGKGPNEDDPRAFKMNNKSQFRSVIYEPKLENGVVTTYTRVARVEDLPFTDETLYPATITSENLRILNEDGQIGVADPHIGIGSVSMIPNGPNPNKSPGNKPAGPNPNKPAGPNPGSNKPTPTAGRRSRRRRQTRRKTSRRKQ
jgi:hypothetical protein